MQIANPTVVITSNRVAEFSAIFFFNGCASAVIDATERCTPSALSKPNMSPTPKNMPTFGEPSDAAIATAATVSTSEMTNRRKGRNATEGNTNGASCAGVVTAAPQSSFGGSCLVARCVAR